MTFTTFTIPSRRRLRTTKEKEKEKEKEKVKAMSRTSHSPSPSQLKKSDPPSSFSRSPHKGAFII